MAEDKTGWSEKGKRSGRDKQSPKEQGGAGARESEQPAKDETSTMPTRPSKREASEPAAREGSVVRTRSEDQGARKVAKAAATAGQRDVSFVTRLGFPSLIALICLLGIGVVFYAWTAREALISPAQGDHWHAVYGVYDCTSPAEDKYVPPFQSARDETGIHSHGDGVMHIHPFFELSSGDRAQFNHWFNEMGIDVTPERITLDNGAQLVAGTECADGSGPAEIRVLYWQFDFQATADDRPDPEVITENFRDIKYENDRSVYVIAFAAAGTDADIPLPPEDRFNTMNSVSAAIEYNPTELIPQDTSVTVTGDADDGTGLVPTDTGVGDEAEDPADE